MYTHNNIIYRIRSTSAMKSDYSWQMALRLERKLNVQSLVALSTAYINNIGSALALCEMLPFQWKWCLN